MMLFGCGIDLPGQSKWQITEREQMYEHRRAGKKHPPLQPVGRVPCSQKHPEAGRIASQRMGSIFEALRARAAAQGNGLRIIGRVTVLLPCRSDRLRSASSMRVWRFCGRKGGRTEGQMRTARGPAVQGCQTGAYQPCCRSAGVAAQKLRNKATASSVFELLLLFCEGGEARMKPTTRLQAQSPGCRTSLATPKGCSSQLLEERTALARPRARSAYAHAFTRTGNVQGPRRRQQLPARVGQGSL